MTGQFTNFVQGATSVSFGAGVRVNSVNVTNATSLTVNIPIEAGAALGGRTLTVTTGVEVVSLPTAFTVAGDPNLPLDPVTVASRLNLTVATDMKSSTEFLYTGTKPIQTGVAPGMIDARRAAVVRGKVKTRDGAPLSGVRMTVIGHSEFGQTLSRADGIFDIAINGGSFATVRYDKTGFASAQRQVNVPWQDFAFLPDVVLIQTIKAERRPVPTAFRAILYPWATRTSCW